MLGLSLIVSTLYGKWADLLGDKNKKLKWANRVGLSERS